MSERDILVRAAEIVFEKGCTSTASMLRTIAHERCQEPSPPPPGSVRVRIAVAVGDDGVAYPRAVIKGNIPSAIDYGSYGIRISHIGVLVGDVPPIGVPEVAASVEAFDPEATA